MANRLEVSGKPPRTVLPFSDMLLKKDVRLVDQSQLVLKCNRCGAEWRLKLSARSQLMRGYWRCPDGCHAKDFDEYGVD